jgi:hypothetical protein
MNQIKNVLNHKGISDIQEKYSEHNEQPSSYCYFENTPLVNPLELTNQIEQLQYEIDNFNQITEQATSISNLLPLLTQSNLNKFKSDILDPNGCPLTFDDFPIPPTTTINYFNEYDHNIFTGWMFCIYHVKNQYHISQYTTKGLELAKSINPPLDLKFRINFAKAVIVTFKDLQIIEQCFLINKSQNTLRKVLSQTYADADTLLSDINVLQDLQKYQDTQAQIGYCNDRCILF